MRENSVLAAELLSHLTAQGIVCSNKTQDDILPFIEEAKADIAFHIRYNELPSYFEGKVKQLAKIRIQKSFAEKDRIKSKSYSEGSVSKSETYLTSADYEQQETALFASINTSRRCRVVTE